MVGLPHLLVVDGYKGSESYADQLALVDQLITVLCASLPLRAGCLHLLYVVSSLIVGSHHIFIFLSSMSFPFLAGMPRLIWLMSQPLSGLLAGFSVPIAPEAVQSQRCRIFGMPIFRNSVLSPQGRGRSFVKSAMEVLPLGRFCRRLKPAFFGLTIAAGGPPLAGPDSQERGRGGGRRWSGREEGG